MMPQNILDFLTQQQQPQQPQPDDTVKQILSARFEPNFQDVGNSALAGISSNQYVNPQSSADQRMQNAMKQLAAVAEFQKINKPDLPQGYRMNPQTGQAELVPGVDPSFAKKADPYAMPTPVILPNGQPGFAPRAVLTNPGYQPIPAGGTTKPPAGYGFGPVDETGAPTLVPITGGPADPTNKPVNEYQGKSGLFAARMEQSEPILDKLKNANTLTQKGLANVPGGNYLVSNDYQQLDQAKRNFINATLRQESGAAINQSEFDNAEKQYFPQPGDRPDVIEQKRQNRTIAIQQMRQSAGAAYRKNTSGAPDPRIEKARAAGYSDQEIETYLNGGK